jgi:hypothetical protein
VVEPVAIGGPEGEEGVAGLGNGGIWSQQAGFVKYRDGVGASGAVGHREDNNYESLTEVKMFAE